MKLSNKTGVFVSISSLAVLLLALYPNLPNPYGSILRILAVGGIGWFLYFYFNSLGDPTENGENDSPQVDSNFNLFPKPHVDQLFQELVSKISLIIQSNNDSYQPELYLFEANSEELAKQYNPNSPASQQISIQNNLVKQIMETNGLQTIYQKDCGSEWNEIFGEKQWRGSECVIAHPIQYNQSTVGLLIVYMDHFNALSNATLNIVSQAASIISQNLKSLDQLDFQSISNLKKDSMLSFISNLDFNNDEVDIYQKFSILLNEFIPSDHTVFSSASSFFAQGVVHWSRGNKSEYVVGEKFNIVESLLGLPMVVDGIITDQILEDRFKAFIPNGGDPESNSPNSVLGFLIHVGDEKLISCILEREDHKKFNPNEIQTINAFIQILKTVLNWQQEYQRIYLNATQDGLSGLLNHKTFMDRFDEEIQRAKRFNYELVMLMFDLDKFKRINDTLGHPYGDYVIQSVSQILKENVRLIDPVARYGGEEFVIVLVNTNIEKALPVAKRIVESVASYPFSMDGKDVKMTISCGMSEYPHQSESIREVIDYADQAMYRGKKQGGNRVTIYENNE